MFTLTLFGISLIELNWLSMVVRLLLAAACGGILGIERKRRGRAAGMRTYALVCAGSALVMMTSQFINEAFNITTDPGRMGAQVVSGVGFLCAGTILLTGHHKLMGLTTAAALWAAACTGLAIGVGFYAGALVMFALIMIMMVAFAGYSNRLGKMTSEMHLYVVLTDADATARLLTKLHDCGYEVTDLVEATTEILKGVAISCTLSAEKRVDRQLALHRVREVPGVLYPEEV